MTDKRNLTEYGVEPHLLVLLCMATVLAYALPPLKTVLAITFLLIVPGMILLNGIPLRDGVTRLTLSLALSLALASITAQVILAINSWFALDWPFEAGFRVLLVLSLLLSVGQMSASRYAQGTGKR